MLNGHILDRLPEIPSNSVDCIVMSPPYLWARHYDIPDMVWGGSADCAHEWRSVRYYHEGGGVHAKNRFIQGGEENAKLRRESRWRNDTYCVHCGGWLGQHGWERSAVQYIAHSKLYLRELYRILKPTGTLWLNIADSYYKKASQLVPQQMQICMSNIGWTIRKEIPWDKGGTRPKTDRPASTTESIILAVKAKNREPYYYDREAPYSQDAIWRFSSTGRAGHNAGFSLELPTRCITIGCPPGGVVLDPFAGSGTTAQAAALLGRSSIGIELNSKYCEATDGGTRF